MQKTNFFEKYPKTTMMVILTLSSFLGLYLLEKLASSFGLGKPILYQSHPIYGYRPLPNQTVARNKNCIIKTNNLALRAEEDWNEKEIENKVLFLGDSVTYGGSYINNRDLFSQVAVKPFSNLIAGNGGVNAWGVENVHALVKELQFYPAKTIVSTFPECDFSRGLMRIGGQAFWVKAPRYALEELAQYFIYILHNKKYRINAFAEMSIAEKQQVLRYAVRHLKEMDDFLKSQNRHHLIYISPTLLQTLGEEEACPYLKALFAEYDLPVIYIQERLPKLSKTEYKTLYHDNVHLSKEGHALWGEIISDDLQKISLKENS